QRPGVRSLRSSGAMPPCCMSLPPGCNSNDVRPRDRGKSYSNGRKTIVSAVSSSCECTQCLCSASCVTLPIDLLPPLSRLGPDGATRAVERRAHAHHLLSGEHDHRVVVHIVHVVHKHIAIRAVVARGMREVRFAEVRV